VYDKDASTLNGMKQDVLGGLMIDFCTYDCMELQAGDSLFVIAGKSDTNPDKICHVKKWEDRAIIAATPVLQTEPHPPCC
jgi:hypothetical protein